MNKNISKFTHVLTQLLFLCVLDRIQIEFKIVIVYSSIPAGLIDISHQTKDYLCPWVPFQILNMINRLEHKLLYICELVYYLLLEMYK